VDKAANIVEPCGALQHGRVLEIGGGDGAILQRLAELKFGDRANANAWRVSDGPGDAVATSNAH
jgi:hypothetical protein